ncbi:MAG TPA: hypothetical protein VN824_01750, partial [Puia sp.]|nr:hypothetical protein [Puia sp.]
MNRTFKKGRMTWRGALAAVLLLSAQASPAQQTKPPSQQTTPPTQQTRQQQPGSGTAAGSAAPQIHELSITQAVDYATKNAVQVKNALLDYQIQEQSNR